MLKPKHIKEAKNDMKLVVSLNLGEIHEDSAERELAYDAESRIDLAIDYLEAAGYNIKLKE